MSGFFRGLCRRFGSHCAGFDGINDDSLALELSWVPPDDRCFEMDTKNYTLSVRSTYCC
jgi:hypothetical protein